MVKTPSKIKYLNNFRNNLRHCATFFLQNLPALFLLGWDSNNGALVLFLQLALGGVDGVVLDYCVDLALLVRNVGTLSLHHRLLLSDVPHAGGIDTLEI